MNPSPKVSIILPTYNRAGYIVEAIESVRRQTFREWELIVVDDGSDDDTEKVMGLIHDERLHFIKAGRIGVNGTIKNIGLTVASAPFIAFIDSDDCWADDKLEKQLAALEKHPESAFCLTGGYDFREHGKPISFFYRQREGERTGNIFLSFFRSEAAATMPTLLFRRECLEKTGRFGETKPFSDVDFLLTLAYHFDAVILYEPLFFRRIHDANYSNLNSTRNYEDGIATIREYRDKKMLPPALARNALFRVHINFGEEHLIKKKRGKAIHQFLCAWKNKPFSIIPLKKTGKAILGNLKQA